jgi:putative transferase (TIGR04331 family)
MYLATTADQKFWKQDEPIIFLGEWCKVFDQKLVWEKLDYEVLPYHWNDRKKLYDDYKYLDAVYEKKLKEMTERLNTFHGVSYSNRYWRIVLGPWLYLFIQILFDRYLSIQTAIDSGKVRHTWIPSIPVNGFVPLDFLYFKSRLCIADDYNLFLYGRIIETLKGIPYQIKPVESSSNSTGDYIKNPAELFDKTFIKKLLLLYSKIIPDRWVKYVFINSYLKIQNLATLQLALGQVPYLYSPFVKSIDTPTNPTSREKLVLSAGDNQFEALLNSLIPEQIPKVYLEGYSDMSQRSLEAFPKHPKVIFSANGVHGYEGFQFWAAHQVERGVKLAGTPHGGHSGTGAWSANELHEHKVADRYYTWGWKDPAEPKIRPLASGQLIGIDKKIKSDPEGGILLVAGSYPRYSYTLFSAPIGPQVLDYIREQESFCKKVSNEVHKLLLLRLYPREQGWKESSRWAEFDPSLNLYQKKDSIYKQMNKSRLAVVTYIGTTYLETFAANYPTILFWNPDHNESRPSAKPFFDKLRRVGVLHDSPESAAVKVNEIYLDPLSWWMSPQVQEAKDMFCDQFARTSRTWRSQWKSELRKLAHE